MTLRERDGKRQSVHLNPKAKANHRASESPRHLALKERIATAAKRGGFAAEIEESSSDDDLRSDVLIHGADGSLLGCEVQISPQSAPRTRARSENSREHGITPLWTTVDPKAELINQAPWTRVDNQPPEMVRAGTELLVRGGARELVTYRCDHTLPTPCPELGRGRCGRLHGRWELKLGLMFDDLIVHAAAQEWMPLERSRGRGSEWMWVPAADAARFADAQAETAERAKRQERERAETNDRVCTYGQETGIRSAPAPIRDRGGAFVEAVVTDSQADLEQTLPAEIAAWIAEAMPGQEHLPCGHYLEVQGGVCGAAPTRQYIGGPRCWHHTPRRSPAASNPEPHQGRSLNRPVPLRDRPAERHLCVYSWPPSPPKLITPACLSPLGAPSWVSHSTRRFRLHR